MIVLNRFICFSTIVLNHINKIYSQYLNVNDNSYTKYIFHFCILTLVLISTRYFLIRFLLLTDLVKEVWICGISDSVSLPPTNVFPSTQLQVQNLYRSTLIGWLIVLFRDANIIVGVVDWVPQNETDGETEGNWWT